MEVLLPGLAGDPSAPPEVLIRLKAANIDRSGPARRRDLPPEAAAVLATDPEVTVRSDLAGSPDLPPVVQVVLAGDAPLADDDGAVRRRALPLQPTG
ncbi:hypothetical protein ACWGKW_40900 [Streptomyces sp. NPDC054766]